MSSNVLLMSSSRASYDNEWLGTGEQAMREMLTDQGVGRVTFVPYAGVKLVSGGTPEENHAKYVDMARAKFGRMGFALDAVSESDPVGAIQRAEAIVTGGGNTWRLQDFMLRTGIMDAIRQRVKAEGVPYIGWSAGSNVACPNMRTTNDMAVVEPTTTESLGLIDGQINAHYRDPLQVRDECRDQVIEALAGILGREQAEQVANEIFSKGESRLDRLEEFVEISRRPVLGLYEGSSLRIFGGKTTLRGKNGANLVSQAPDGKFATTPYVDGDDMSEILRDAV